MPDSPTPTDIRAARKAAGLTQTAAAELIYRRLRTWQDWESGTAAMNPAMWELWQLKTRQKRPTTR